MRTGLIAAACAALLAGIASAHHSFAVFFESDRLITVKGTVADFQFRNPHGIIRLNVRGDAAGEQLWKAETNSPSILERRGWTRDILKPGDAIVVQGWPARDGSNYLRMRSVTRADGTPVGVPFEQAEQK
jgi:hypothetical protein